MRRYSPPYYSPPRRGYGGRARSPLRRGYGRSKEQNNGSLLVRNIPLDCRPEELRVPFERFGLVRDVYIPRDYHTGEPRGFAFVQFVDPYEAAEAQYHMNRAIFAGREITVVVAAETRKRPEEMRRRSSVRGTSGYGGRQSRYDLGLVQYLIRVPPITLPVLVVVIVRGPILLLPGVELTTPFPQIEGKRTMQDHQENPLKGETVTVVGGHTLQVMRMMVMKSKMVMCMARKLHMTPMKHEGPGSLHLDERHDHLLDLDLGLLICQPSR